MTFSKTSEFKVAGEGPKSELEQLQQLMLKWYSALEEGYQSKLFKVLKLKQDDRERLFFVMNETSQTQPLKTTVNARCLRDDLAVFDIKLVYTTAVNMGTRQEAEFKHIKDPKAVGVDPLETVKLVNRTIKGST